MALPLLIAATFRRGASRLSALCCPWGWRGAGVLLVLLSMPLVEGWQGGLCLAQSDDLGVGLAVSAEHKLARGLKLQLEAEVRTQDQAQSLERWALDMGLCYRLASSLKADAGYVLMDRYHLSEVTNRGNILNGYWAPRHRWYGGVSWQYQWHRLKLSWRERYQLTHSPLQYVPKYVGPTAGRPDHVGMRLTDEVKAGDQEHILRSRLQASYNIRHCSLTPIVSVELLSDLAQGMAVDQLRYSLGIGYAISKHRTLSLDWRYKDRADGDEANGHLFTLSYAFDF